MDKKSITGLVLVALIFIGFSIYTTKQQKEYQEKLAEYNAYVAAQEAAEAAEESAIADEVAATLESEDAEEREAAERIARFGETLALSREGVNREVTVENDYLQLTFSTLGGQITDAVLKEYTKYAPKDERNEPVKLFDPSTARFDMSFYVKNGTRNVQVNT